MSLNQADFAELGGVVMNSQNRYEAAATEPSAAYLANLAINGIDVGYLLTGNRSADSLDARAQRLLEFFGQLLPPMQDAVLVAVEAIGRASMDLPVQQKAAGVTVHDQRRDYRSDPDQA